MNNDQFDLLVRSVGPTQSRRSALRALAGLTIGAATAVLGRGSAAEAATGRCRKRCRSGKRCVGGACVPACATVLTKAGCMIAQPGVWLCPPGTDLGGAVLSRCDLLDDVLRGVDLSGADLSGANLRDADLTDADLSDADLDGADLAFVQWTNATCPDGTNANAQNPPTCCGHLAGAVPKAGC